MPVRTDRRFLAAPEVVKPNPVVSPTADAAERERIAGLRIWVQCLLWATPFTAFLSARLFSDQALQGISYVYLLVGILINLVIGDPGIIILSITVFLMGKWLAGLGLSKIPSMRIAVVLSLLVMLQVLAYARFFLGIDHIFLFSAYWIDLSPTSVFFVFLSWRHRGGA